MNARGVTFDFGDLERRLDVVEQSAHQALQNAVGLPELAARQELGVTAEIEQEQIALPPSSAHCFRPVETLFRTSRTTWRARRAS